MILIGLIVIIVAVLVPLNDAPRPAAAVAGR
jgi:hypothetical protein